MFFYWVVKVGYVNICYEFFVGGIFINVCDVVGEIFLEWVMLEGEEFIINFFFRGDKLLNRVEMMNFQSIYFSVCMGELDMVKSLFEKIGILEM